MCFYDDKAGSRPGPLYLYQLYQAAATIAEVQLAANDLDYSKEIGGPMEIAVVAFREGGEVQQRKGEGGACDTNRVSMTGW